MPCIRPCSYCYSSCKIIILNGHGSSDKTENWKNFKNFFSLYSQCSKVLEDQKHFQCKIIILMAEARCMIVQFVRFGTRKNCPNCSDEYETSRKLAVRRSQRN